MCLICNPFDVPDTTINMVLVGVILSIITLVTGGYGNYCYTCIKVNTTCHNITHLLQLPANFRNDIVIHKMGILRSVNVLYYSFEPSLTDVEYYKVGYINLDDPSKFGAITAPNTKVMNFGTFDMDQNNQLVYLGGSDGIFVLETKERIVAFFSSRGDPIQNLVYKGNVYFVIDGQNKITRKKGDNFDSYLEGDRIKNFVITRSDVVVYLSVFGLFASKRNETVQLSKNAFFRGITIDLDDTVYAWWIDGIYKVLLERNLSQSRIERVAYLPNIGSMVFDNDNNILFTSDKDLYALTETNASTIC